MRIQPRRFSESPNQNTRGTWCVSAVLLRYVSAIRVWRIWHPTYGVIHDEGEVIKRGTYASTASRAGP